MKAILKKSVENRFWGTDDYDILDLNPINKAITSYYLPYLSSSPLKTFLLKRMTTFKQMYLYLKVYCEEDSSVVKSLSLKCNLLDDVERMYDDNKVDWGKIDECMTKYFQRIGYAEIECTDDEGIVSFLKRLEQDVLSEIVTSTSFLWRQTMRKPRPISIYGMRKRKVNDLKRVSVLERTAIACMERIRTFLRLNNKLS